MPHPQDVAVPSLPRAAVDEHNLQGGRLLYTADQMRAYARAAVIADRAAGRASAEPEGVALTAALRKQLEMTQAPHHARYTQHERDFYISGFEDAMEFVRAELRVVVCAALAAAPTPTASIAPKAEAEAARFPFAGFNPKFCPGSNPDNPQEWPDDAAPVAQAAAGADELQRFADAVRDGIADFVADRWSDRKHGLAEIESSLRCIEVNAALIVSKLSPRPSADADRASGGGV